MASPPDVMPFLATLWFLCSTPIVLIDAVFVLTRQSLGSCIDRTRHPLQEWFPLNYWKLYASYDKRYAPNDDTFVVLQSYLNVSEAIMGLVAVSLALLGWHRSGLGLAMIVSVMTMYKTVMYFLMEEAENGRYTSHNTLMEKIMMIYIPSSFWIIIPAINLYQIFYSYSSVILRMELRKIKSVLEQQKAKQK